MRRQHEAIPLQTSPLARASPKGLNTMTLTPQRAREIIWAQSQFPYWGNYSKFMTEEESAFVSDLFKRSENGNVSIASIVELRARADYWEQPPHFDDKDAAMAREYLDVWNTRKGPRVGDWVKMLDGTERRFTHDWGNDIQTTCGSGDSGSFYFGKGFMSFSGGLDRAIDKAAIVETEEARPGSAWFFHHNRSGAGRGVYFTVPCRVFRQVEG
jgi:hypothetical protein